MLRLIQICLATIVGFSALGLSQTPNQSLQQGVVVKQQIKGGEKQVFTIPVNAPGQYLHVQIEQQGAILRAKLTPPSGGQSVGMDNPAGQFGPIYLAAISSVAGNYQLEIFSADSWANPVNFEITLDPLRPSRPEDQTIIAAQETFAEGRKQAWDNHWAEALPYYTEALRLWQTANDERSQALTHFALNEAYSGLGETKRPDAIRELEATLAIVNTSLAPNDWRIKAAALNDLGGHCRDSGQLDRAFSLLDQAYNLFLSHQDRRGQASALNNLAIANGQSGNYSLALQYVEKALPLREAENDEARALNIINSLGAASLRLGDLDKARTYYEQALEKWSKRPELTGDDRHRVGTLRNNLAVANEKLGHWDKALESYDLALTTFSEGDPGRPATLDSKGDFYTMLGDLKKASACYDQALAMLPPEKFNLDLKAGILVHIGQLFALQDNLSGAVTNFEQARSLNPAPPRLADVLTNLASALAAQGKFDEAMAAYDQALSIQLVLKDKRGQALALQKRGETYNLRKQNTPAVDDLKKALALWEELKDPRGRAATLNTLAHVEQDRGALKDALKYSDEVLSIVESQRTTLSNNQLRALYLATQENYYDLNIDLNIQLSKALGTEYLARAFATAEKARARVLLETLTEAEIDRVDADNNSDPQFKSLTEELRTTKAKLTAKGLTRTRVLNVTPNPVQVATLDQELDELAEKVRSLETQIRATNSRYATLTKPQPVTLSEAQQQLDGETLLLEYALGEKRSYVFAIAKNGPPAVVELASRNQIERAASRVTQVLANSNRPQKNESLAQATARTEKDFTDASTQLAQLVVEPVVTQLGDKRLAVVLDGSLQSIPFHALPVTKSSAAGSQAAHATETAATPLLLDHEIVYLPSASVLALQRQELANRKPAKHTIAILANPVFEPDDERVTNARKKKPENTAQTQPSQPNSPAAARTRSNLDDALRDVGVDHLTPLPFSQDEADAILTFVPKGEVLAAVGFDANRATAMSRVLAQYRTIHFATHGILNLEHPELSGIVLSLVDKTGAPQDGYLFLHDVYNLNLPAELVVLSACQTGLGKQVRGEGLIALTRGFMYAGAARLVASLWKVNDAATAALMKEFYKEMFMDGKKPAAALRGAQLKLRDTKRWSAPVYWAGFFIQGEWR